MRNLSSQLLAEESTPGIGEGEKVTQDLITKNKDSLKNALLYIQKNREAIDEVTLGKLNEQLSQESVDPIQKLQELSKTELAFAYDTLLKCLKQREALIERRIKE